jgi:hypothetical protein
MLRFAICANSQLLASKTPGTSLRHVASNIARRYFSADERTADWALVGWKPAVAVSVMCKSNPMPPLKTLWYQTAPCARLIIIIISSIFIFFCPNAVYIPSLNQIGFKVWLLKVLPMQHDWNRSLLLNHWGALLLP